MARGIIINVHSATLSQGNVYIIIGTKRPQHLWLYGGCEQPTWQDNRKYIRKRPRIHAFSYIFKADFHLAQQESGDTILHTFVFPWPKNCTRLYYMFADYLPAQPRQSISPIFAVERQVEPAFAEDWLLGFTGRYPWVWTHSGPASKIDAHGQETVIIDPGWGDSAISVALDAYLSPAQRTLQGLYIAVEIAASSGAYRTGNTDILLGCRNPADTIDAALKIAVSPPAEIIGWPAENTISGHGAGTYIIDPLRIIHSPDYPSTGGTVPGDDWRLHTIGFRALSGTIVDPLNTAHMTVGVITIGAWSETLKRVDASWRIQHRPDALFFNAPDHTFYRWENFPP